MAPATFDVPDFEDCDDSSAQIHEVIPPTDEELEAEIDRFMSIFTEPQHKRGDA